MTRDEVLSEVENMIRKGIVGELSYNEIAKEILNFLDAIGYDATIENALKSAQYTRDDPNASWNQPK